MKPLGPKEAYEDQVRIERDSKKRDELSEKKVIEKKENERKRKKREKKESLFSIKREVKRVLLSVQVLGLVCKDAYISTNELFFGQNTNELNLSLSSSVVSLSQKIHEKVIRANIDRKNGPYARQTNKSRQKIFFEPGDLVWVRESQINKNLSCNQEGVALSKTLSDTMTMLARYIH